MQTNYVNRINKSQGASKDPFSPYSTTYSMSYPRKGPISLRSTIDLGTLQQFTTTSGYSSNQANATTKKAKKDTFSSTTKDSLAKTAMLSAKADNSPMDVINVKLNNMCATGYHANVGNYMPQGRHEMRPALSNKYLFRKLKRQDPIEAENKGSGPLPNTTTTKYTFTSKPISMPYQSGTFKSLDEIEDPNLKMNTTMFAGGHNANKVVTVWPRYEPDELLTTQKQFYKSFDADAYTQNSPQKGSASSNLKTGYFRVSDTKSKFDNSGFLNATEIEPKTSRSAANTFRKLAPIPASILEKPKSCVSNGYQQCIKQISEPPFQAKKKFLSFSTTTKESIKDPKEFFKNATINGLPEGVNLTPTAYVRMYPKANYR